MSIRIDGTNTTANPGITGSDTDTGLQFGTNEVKVVTDGSDRVTVDSSGRVLVAITTSDANAGADDLQIGDRTASTERGITIGSTAGGGIRFADAGSTNAGIIEYQHSSNNMRFYTDANERVQITGNGTIKLISSGGIDFSGIQTNASGMTGETLDSYEEGTWTPTCNSDGTIDTPQYTCHYTKIGRLVTVNAEIAHLSNITSTNPIKIGGLPFVPSGTTGEYGSAACHGERYGHITIVAFVQYQSNEWVIRFRKGVGSNNYNDLRHEDINNATDNNLRFTLIYEVP